MSPTSNTATGLRLAGINLALVRAVFILLSLVTMIFFGLGISVYYQGLVKGISLETLETLRSLGLSSTFFAVYQTGLAIVLAIGSCIAGIIIFRFKSDEWVAMVVAFTLIGMGANAFEPLGMAASVIGSKTPVHFAMAMILASHPLTCYILPDGKFPQKWMKVVAWIWFLWLMVSVFWKSFPVNLFNWSGNGFDIYLYSLLTVLLTGIYALIYRYAHTENAIKREQLKWVVFSIAVAIVVAVGSDILIEFFEKTDPSKASLLIANMLTQTISVIALLSVPTAMVFSILRYRLYDIELVINRSLIYGLLTIVLAAVFAGILGSLQSLFHAITGGQNPPPVGIVVATLAVFSLFKPTLTVSRNFVNKKIFGIEFNFTDAKRLNAKVEKVSHLPSRVVTSIGGYTDLELISRGGMGEIYKARHPTLNHTIAVKVLSLYFKDDPDFNKRFAREAEMMAKLRHPNIITIHDFGEQDGLPYIVMDYLTGETVSQILKAHNRLSLEESLPLLQDVASALDYAHGQGVIHRDIKPSNVIVEPMNTATNGRSDRAILMDFGIARFVDENSTLTASGDVLGTADYISPEQIHGSTELDSRTDQYSFAVMTYQILTGRKLFERNNTWAMIRSHLEEPPPDPRLLVPMPDVVAEALLRALAKKPEERFESVGQFVSELCRAS